MYIIYTSTSGKRGGARVNEVEPLVIGGQAAGVPSLHRNNKSVGVNGGEMCNKKLGLWPVRAA